MVSANENDFGSFQEDDAVEMQPLRVLDKDLGSILQNSISAENLAINFILIRGTNFHPNATCINLYEYYM
jgi:hypothetical protein